MTVTPRGTPVPVLHPNRHPPSPPEIRGDALKLVHSEIRSVYEPFHGFQSELSCLAKDRSAQIKHELQLLTAVSMRQAVPPSYVEHFTKQSAAKLMYTTVDLYVGIVHRTLAKESCDLTIYRLAILPQGYTNWLTVFHIDITFILRHEIDIAPDFLEVINILEPRTSSLEFGRT